jgi:dihydrofolate synthase / folylpolyglutamate synthase
MHIEAIKTRSLLPPKDDLLEVLSTSLPPLKEEEVIAVTSKVVAIWQGRCEPMPKEEAEMKARKEALIKREAERYLDKDISYPYSRIFTIYEGIFGSSSGIDESNGNGWFILLPTKADEAAQMIRNHLRTRDDIKKLGVVITDSRPAVMRNGTIGIALGHAGFDPVYDYRGESDIFGRKLRVERQNIADCIASAAILAMGEGAESTPVAIFSGLSHITWGGEGADDFMLKKAVPMERDVFAQFLSTQKWHKGGGNA